jgi:hypothetical protein
MDRVSVEEVTDKVRRMLVELNGRASVDADGDFVIDFDSATVFVRVLETSTGTVMVRVSSVVLLDVPLKPELYRWVATESRNFYFGQFEVVEGDDGTGLLLFEHFLLGEYLDIDELGFAVHGMGTNANELDDELQNRFGGRRFNEP